jgi:hypothetical protein
MQAVRALYLNHWFRIPFKFVALFALTKLGYDYYEYRSAFRWRKTNPRFVTLSPRSAATMSSPPPPPSFPFPIPTIPTGRATRYQWEEPGHQAFLSAAKRDAPKVDELAGPQLRAG